MKNSKEAEDAIKLTVAPPKPKESLFENPVTSLPAKQIAKPVAKPTPAVVEEEEEEAPPPKKVEVKKPAASTASLESLVDGWDDE
jgi:hypothetical protein